MAERPCLHCALRDAIQAHAEAVDADNPKLGGPTISAPEALNALARLTASLIVQHPDPDGQVNAFAFFQRVLAADLQEAGLSAFVTVTEHPPAAEAMH
jgi:hypothetical protein